MDCNCSYIAHKNNISSHLEVIRQTLDIHSFDYDNFNLEEGGDFNAGVSDKAMLEFCKSWTLKCFIKQPTCFKNPENPSCIRLLLTNGTRIFRNSYVTAIMVSDFQMMAVSVMKLHYRNTAWKVFKYRVFFWSVFSFIRTEYGNLRSKSPYSVRIQENTDQKKLRIWTFFTRGKLPSKTINSRDYKKFWNRNFLDSLKEAF